MSTRLCALLVCAMAAACGGSTTAPLAPTSPLAVTPSSTATARISGAVQTPAGTAAGMTVEVVGSALRVTVDADNTFAFPAVQAGQHRLRFSGAGANAEVGLEPIASGETMNLVVHVSGGSASVQSGHKVGANETRFQGRIASIDLAAGTLVVGERTVTTSGSTIIRNGSRAIALTALSETTIVEVTGVEDEGAVAARLIDVLPDPKLNLDGTVAALTGTASAFEFLLGDRRIVGGAATEFKGGSNASFARLADGLAVHVAAVDKGEYAEATRINLPADPAATPGSATGTLTEVTGTSPALTLTVGTATVNTTAATIVRRDKTVVSLAALAVGQTLTVDGTLESDGSLTAAKIEIAVVAASAAGTLTAISGESPVLTLTVGTSTVVTDAATTVRQGNLIVTLAALAVDQTVSVDGTLDTDGTTILATRVQIEGAPRPTPAPVAFDAEGVVSAVGGTCPSATFTLAGKTITTTAATNFVQLTCATLTNGTTVRVKGTEQADGTVIASLIQFKKNK